MAHHLRGLVLPVKGKAWGEKRIHSWSLASVASEVQAEPEAEQVTEEVTETAGRWQAPPEEITRRRNFAIISHPVSDTGNRRISLHGFGFVAVVNIKSNEHAGLGKDHLD